MREKWKRWLGCCEKRVKNKKRKMEEKRKEKRKKVGK